MICYENKRLPAWIESQQVTSSSWRPLAFNFNQLMFAALQTETVRPIMNNNSRSVTAVSDPRMYVPVGDLV